MGPSLKGPTHVDSARVYCVVDLVLEKPYKSISSCEKKHFVTNYLTYLLDYVNHCRFICSWNIPHQFWDFTFF